MDTAIVVFTRDLRLHDNPALHQACSRARQVGRVLAGPGISYKMRQDPSATPAASNTGV